MVKGVVIADSLPPSAADALRAAGWSVDVKAGRKPDELGVGEAGRHTDHERRVHGAGGRHG